MSTETSCATADPNRHDEARTDRRNALIVAPFVALPGEPGFNRFVYLADLMTERGWRVTLVTSSFCHSLKRHRSPPDTSWHLVLLQEPGYSKNISVRRILSHRAFALSLRQWLRNQREEYSLVYAALPTPESALETYHFARRARIPFVVDVQDLWPDAIAVGFGARSSPLLESALSVLLARMKLRNRTVLRGAQGVVAVSSTYLDWARVNGAKSGVVCYIGTDLGVVDSIPRLQRTGGRLWVTYQGTLSHSYDVKTLLSAVAILRDEGLPVDCQILGDGPHRQGLEVYNKRVNASATFWGFAPYGDLIAVLKASDIAVNPIRQSSKTSLPNKVFDYMGCGLPIVNSVAGELAGLLTGQGAGLNYVPGDAYSLAGAVRTLASDRDLRWELGRNARRLATLIGDRRFTYANLVDMLTHVGEWPCLRTD